MLYELELISREEYEEIVARFARYRFGEDTTEDSPGEQLVREFANLFPDWVKDILRGAKFNLQFDNKDPWICYWCGRILKSLEIDTGDIYIAKSPAEELSVGTNGDGLASHYTKA